MGTRLRHLLLACLLVSGSAAALDEIHLHIADVEGPAWRARDINLELRWRGTDQADLALAFAVTGLPAPLHNVRRVAVRCKQAHIGADAVRCSGGVLRLVAPELDRPELAVDFSYRHADRSLQFRLKGLALAGGSADLKGTVTAAAWRVEINAMDLDLQRVAALAGDGVALPQGVQGSGRVSFVAQLSGSGQDVGAATVRGELKDLAFADAQWRKAGEGIAGTFDVSARADQKAWLLQGTLSLKRGELLFYPFYLESSPGPITLEASAVWDADASRLSVERASLGHPDIQRAEASFVVFAGEQPRVERADVRLQQVQIRRIIGTFLHPPLEGTALADLESSGEADVQLTYRHDGVSSATVRLRDVYVDDNQGRYGVYGMDGELNWTTGAGGATSRLAWQGGHVYKVPLGASRAVLHGEGLNVRLAEAVELPVFDGMLQIGSLGTESLGTPDARWYLDARLLPVSMATVSHTLGWPAMRGKLSGVIPSLTYQHGILQVGGALLVRAFDGDIVVHNMRLAQPFSTVPVLNAEVDVANIDLASLTETFSFGKIEGKLAGAMQGLRMERWQPVEFEARFATPQGDRSRHRISQKAIDSLSSLGGGGAAGALSRSLLRFFEEFSYDRIGISCRLRNGVCEMDGIGPAQGGYYIVKGGGLPRIDVIGFNRRIDWDVLLARLKAATQSGGPVIH